MVDEGDGNGRDEAPREKAFLLAAAEQRVLRRLAQRLQIGRASCRERV